MNLDLTTVTAIVGAINGTSALALSAFNAISQRRVQLRVIPKLTAIRRGAFLSSTEEILSDGFACIEVVNLSSFPVTIAEVGFLVIGESGRNVIIPDPVKILPKRLEPRESIEVRATLSAGFPKRVGKAYAKTQCRRIRKGDSIVLRKWRKLQP